MQRTIEQTTEQSLAPKRKNKPQTHVKTVQKHFKLIPIFKLDYFILPAMPDGQRAVFLYPDIIQLNLAYQRANSETAVWNTLARNLTHQFENTMKEEVFAKLVVSQRQICGGVFVTLTDPDQNIINYLSFLRRRKNLTNLLEHLTPAQKIGFVMQNQNALGRIINFKPLLDPIVEDLKRRDSWKNRYEKYLREQPVVSAFRQDVDVTSEESEEEYDPLLLDNVDEMPSNAMEDETSEGDQSLAISDAAHSSEASPIDAMESEITHTATEDMAIDNNQENEKVQENNVQVEEPEKETTIATPFIPPQIELIEEVKKPAEGIDYFLTGMEKIITRLSKKDPFKLNDLLGELANIHTIKFGDLDPLVQSLNRKRIVSRGKSNPEDIAVKKHRKALIIELIKDNFNGTTNYIHKSIFKYAKQIKKMYPDNSNEIFIDVLEKLRDRFREKEKINDMFLESIFIDAIKGIRKSQNNQQPNSLQTTAPSTVGQTDISLHMSIQTSNNRVTLQLNTSIVASGFGFFNTQTQTQILSSQGILIDCLKQCESLRRQDLFYSDVLALIAITYKKQFFKNGSRHIVQDFYEKSLAYNKNNKYARTQLDVLLSISSKHNKQSSSAHQISKYEEKLSQDMDTSRFFYHSIEKYFDHLLKYHRDDVQQAYINLLKALKLMVIKMDKPKIIDIIENAISKIEAQTSNFTMKHS